MRYLDINVASDPVRNQTPYHWTYGILSAVVVIFLAYNLFAFFRYGGELADRKEKLRQVRVQLVAIQEQDDRLRRQVAGWDFTRLSGEAVFAADTILRRTFSWTDLFNQLEQVVPPHVMMVAIRPNITSGGITIRVDGIAKGHISFLEFVENLQDSSLFQRVYPGGERREENKRIFFNLTFDYYPASPEPAPEEILAARVDPVANPGGGKSGDSRLPENKPIPGAGNDPVGEDDTDDTQDIPASPVESPEPVPAAADLPVQAFQDPPELLPEQPEKPTTRNKVQSFTVADLEKQGLRKADLQKMAASLEEETRKLTSLQPEGEGRQLPPVSFHLFLQGETVSEAYRRLARLGKVTIVLEEGLNPGKRISARIRAKDFEQALQQVADKAGHVYWREGEGIYRIGDPADPGFPPASQPITEEDLPGKAGLDGDVPGEDDR